MRFAAISVTGSKGVVYSVGVDETTGKATCTCPAFYYTGRRQGACKHIRFVAEALAGSPAALALTSH